MAVYTAKVFYCSGTTQQDLVTVTMTVGNCPTYGTHYDDGVCEYETHRQTVSFSLSKALDFNLKMFFNVSWEQIRDGGTPTSGIQKWSITIPAGLTNYTWQQFTGQNFVCEETRTCYEDSFEQPAYPSEQ